MEKKLERAPISFKIPFSTIKEPRQKGSFNPLMASTHLHKDTQNTAAQATPSDVEHGERSTAPEKNLGGKRKRLDPPERGLERTKQPRLSSGSSFHDAATNQRRAPLRPQLQYSDYEDRFSHEPKSCQIAKFKQILYHVNAMYTHLVDNERLSRPNGAELNFSAALHELQEALRSIIAFGFWAEVIYNPTQQILKDACETMEIEKFKNDIQIVGVTNAYKLPEWLEFYRNQENLRQRQFSFLFVHILPGRHLMHSDLQSSDNQIKITRDVRKALAIS